MELPKNPTLFPHLPSVPVIEDFSKFCKNMISYVTYALKPCPTQRFTDLDQLNKIIGVSF